MIIESGYLERQQKFGERTMRIFSSHNGVKPPQASPETPISAGAACTMLKRREQFPSDTRRDSAVPRREIP
jgi:hypothetical protein